MNPEHFHAKMSDGIFAYSSAPDRIDFDKALSTLLEEVDQ